MCIFKRLDTHALHSTVFCIIRINLYIKYTVLKVYLVYFRNVFQVLFHKQFYKQLPQQ